MDFSSSASIILNVSTFLFPIILTLCGSIWMCSNKKSSDEIKKSGRPKKNGEKVLVVREHFASPEPPPRNQKGTGTEGTGTSNRPKKTSSTEPDAKNLQQKRTSSAEPDATGAGKNQGGPQPQSFVFPSSAEATEEVKFKSETVNAKTQAQKKKSQPTDSTDLKTPDWMKEPAIQKIDKNLYKPTIKPSTGGGVILLFMGKRFQLKDKRQPMHFVCGGRKCWDCEGVIDALNDKYEFECLPIHSVECDQSTAKSSNENTVYKSAAETIDKSGRSMKIGKQVVREHFASPKPPAAKGTGSEGTSRQNTVYKSAAETIDKSARSKKNDEKVLVIREHFASMEPPAAKGTGTTNRPKRTSSTEPDAAAT